MPNRDVHLRVGAVAGTGCATYRASGRSGPYMFAEAAGGLVGGIAAALLPDWIDNRQLLAWQPALRDKAQHYAELRTSTPAPLLQLGYGILEFLLHLLAGFLAGYASHLALDSLTPSALPILC